MVAQLRTTFLKLAAAMEGAMVSKLAGSLNACIVVVHFELLGEAWRGGKQGALPSVSVLLLHPGHLHQDRPAGGKEKCDLAFPARL